MKRSALLCLLIVFLYSQSSFADIRISNITAPETAEQYSIITIGVEVENYDPEAPEDPPAEPSTGILSISSYLYQYCSPSQFEVTVGEEPVTKFFRCWIINESGERAMFDVDAYYPGRVAVDVEGKSDNPLIAEIGIESMNTPSSVSVGATFEATTTLYNSGTVPLAGELVSILYGGAHFCTPNRTEFVLFPKMRQQFKVNCTSTKAAGEEETFSAIISLDNSDLSIRDDSDDNLGLVEIQVIEDIAIPPRHLIVPEKRIVPESSPNFNLPR